MKFCGFGSIPNITIMQIWYIFTNFSKELEVIKRKNNKCMIFS